MHALALLRRQHEAMRTVLDRLDPEAGHARRTRALFFQHFADVLASHTAIEERIFYPALRVGATEDMLLISAEEHLSVKRIAADLLTLDPDGSVFDAKLAVLRRQLLDHMAEEEMRTFALARNLLGQPRLEELGNQMEGIAGKLLQGEARRRLLAETGEAAPV